MFVQLRSHVNEVNFIQLSSNQHYAELLKPQTNIFFEVKSFNGATKLFKANVNKYNFGSSNWFGGLVVDGDFDFLADISYNDRASVSTDWRNAKEIDL